MLRIRRATAADVELLAEIEADADLRYADSVHPEMATGATIPPNIARMAVKTGQLRVAVENGRVVGWTFETRSEGELCLGQISVRRDAGRRGVGTALLRNVIERARAANESSIVLSTQADVAWNQPWYERFGFVVVDPAQWTKDMHVIAAEQTRGGLDWKTRVFMRLVL